MLSGMLVVAAPQLAAAAGPRIDLRVLVVTDGTVSVTAIAAGLAREGVPTTTITLADPNRPVINDAFLADVGATAQRAKFQAVVVPDAPMTGLTTAEAEALRSYERNYGIRQVDADTWPNVALGMELPQGSSMDGATAAVTTSGRAAGFGYLAGPIPMDAGSYGYLSRPLATQAPGASFTSLVDVTVPGKPTPYTLIGAYTNPDGREELVITASSNEHQLHQRALVHGIIGWATRGVHLGAFRNYFSVHVDDVFLPDDRWSTDANCTSGDDCPRGPNGQELINLPTIRMTPQDVEYLRSWQATTGLKLDLAFNAGGIAEAAAASGGTDPLTTALLANRSEYRWINHTWSHPFLGCLQDFSVLPWRCTTAADGSTQWYPQADITQQIALNQQWAVTNAVGMNPTELITGEHSGLRTLPQQPADNPNLAPSLAATGIAVTASDNSREPAPRAIGGATTLPRYPMNIFYNVGTKAEEVDEYNWIYTSAANGGSGICEGNAASTCITPLDPATGFDSYIVPLEASIALGHVLGNDPRPHYAHQSNLAEGRVLYPVVDAIVAQYRSMFADTAPLVQPTMTEASAELTRQAEWAQLMASTPDAVQGYTVDGVVYIATTLSSVQVPVTVPMGTAVNGVPMATTYGGEGSGWVTVTPTSIPTTTAPTTTAPTTTVPTTTAPTTTAPTTTAPTTTAPTTTAPTTPTTTPPTTVPPPPGTARSGYWMVDAKGTVYGFGDAKNLVLGNAPVGTHTAVDIEATPDFTGYWVVDDAGNVYAFNAPKLDPVLPRFLPGERVTSLSSTASGKGYWLFTNKGRAIPKGDAATYRDMFGTPLNGPVLDSIRTSTGGGYYMVASDGGVFSFGDAAFHGSMGDARLNAPVRSLAPDPDGVGYWLVAGDGGIFAFEAPFRGSMGGKPLNKPVVGMVPYGNGYLMVASDGGIFNFSDKPFSGSLGAAPPAQPIVGVAALNGR
jgi:hypothetical protein